MKRLELFEFEDFNWFPGVIRNGGTNLLVVFHKLMGTAEVISELILKAREKCNFSQVVDLGAGSGGAMLESFKRLADTNTEPLKLMLTDLYPNPKTIQDINSRTLPNIQYNSTSINATNISETPSGLKTMIASFHHMKPEIAKKILLSAEENKELILIYELAKNSVPTILWWILLPISLVILFIMALFMTPFVRPLTLPQLLFTYVIPIIPIMYAWDGQASLMRTYTFNDVQELLGERQNSDYIWEIDDAKKLNGKKVGYYIMGVPVKEEVLK